MEDRFKVGVLLKPHGIKGEIKAYPTTDDAKRFKKLKEVILKPVKGGERILRITSVRFFKNLVILKFDGIDTPETVGELSRAELYVNRSDAVKLEKDEYFIADLIGLRAESEDGSLSGILEDVLQTGANDVYCIRLDDGRELLLPAIKECLKEVSPENGKIVFRLMDGLLD